MFVCVQERERECVCERVCECMCVCASVYISQMLITYKGDKQSIPFSMQIAPTVLQLRTTYETDLSSGRLVTHMLTHKCKLE